MDNYKSPRDAKAEAPCSIMEHSISAFIQSNSHKEWIRIPLDRGRNAYVATVFSPEIFHTTLIAKQEGEYDVLTIYHSKFTTLEMFGVNE